MAPHQRQSSVLGFILVASAVLAAIVIGAVVARGESIVITWNRAVLDAIRAETTPPPLAGRTLAIVHLVLDEATHDTAEDLRREVLAIVSACTATSALFPGRVGDFERVRDAALAEVLPAPTAAEWQRALQIAATFLEARGDDGANRSVTYIPRAEPGSWRRTTPFFRPPELPQWPDVRTFAIHDPVSLVPAGPPALESAAWADALAESRRLGGRSSDERTADEAVTAKFWSDFSYTTTPPGHWNEIAADVARRRGFDEATTARLFAALNVAMADAGIVCWETKYRYNFWRPVTALAGEGWQPLLNTPPHPEYPSGHSAFSGAAAAVLAAFVGSDECEFTVRSDAMPGVERVFHRFSDAAREISLSRVYGGIHYRFSCEDGLAIGRAVAGEVLRRDSTAPGSAKIASR